MTELMKRIGVKESSLSSQPLKGARQGTVLDVINPSRILRFPFAGCMSFHMFDDFVRQRVDGNFSIILSNQTCMWRLHHVA